MTSLAAQLKKLAVPETQTLLSGDFKQASFLFDEREAATFDKQHFYNIGINGLQQLSEKDERFSEFERNIFSPSSQSLQRYVQTSEVNQQLDATLEDFLLRLSPFMQLREAHKAMEWVVHRYNVHLRNVDAFMMCVLPYHDQDPFVRALRLLKMNSNECAKWRWLEPIKKGDTFLPRQTLITHCKSAKGFLGFICDMLSKHIVANTDESGTPLPRHLQRVITFHTQTVLGALLTGPPSEHILSILVPSISAGLRSHDLPDHMMSSYMILSQLFSQTSLEQTLLESLLNVICKNIQPSLLHSAVTLLVLMFQKQAICKVSKKAFKYLTSHPSLIQTLSVMSKEVKTEPFMSPFAAVLAQRALRETIAADATSDSNPDEADDFTPLSLMSTLLDVLSLVSLEKKTIAVIARVVIEWFTKQGEDMAMQVGDVSPPGGAFTVFRLLENRFSHILDFVIKDMSAADASGLVANTAKSLLEFSVTSAKQDMKSDPLASVTVCLNHRHADVRKCAVERLLGDSGLMEDKEGVQSALVLRLQDNDPTVVTAVLERPESLWDLFDNKKLLYDALLKKLNNLGGSPRKSSTRVLVLQALCCTPFDVVEEAELMVIVLSFLMALDVSELELAPALLSSPFALSNKLMGHLNANWLPLVEEAQGTLGTSDEKSLLADLTVKLVDCITAHLMINSQNAETFLKDLHMNLMSTPRPGSTAHLILLTSLSVALRVRKLEVKTSLQRQLSSMIVDVTYSKNLVCVGMKAAKDTPVDCSSLDAVMLDCLSLLCTEEKLPVEFISYLLTKLELTAMPQSLKDLKFWTLSDDGTMADDWLRTVTTIISFLFELSSRKETKVASLAQHVFTAFFKVLESTDSVVKFLCLLWTSSKSQGVTGMHRTHSLLFSLVYFSSMSLEDRTKLLADPSPILPSLLLLLSSKFEQVRDLAFTLVTRLIAGTAADSGYFRWFADNLLHYREEVTKDEKFLAQVLKNILELDEFSLLPPSPKRRRKNSSQPPPSSATLTFLLDTISDRAASDVVRAGLLAVLQNLDSAGSFLPLTSLLKQLLSNSASGLRSEVAGQTADAEVQSQSGAACETDVAAMQVAGTRVLSEEETCMVKLLLQRYTPSVASCVERDSESLVALLDALKCKFLLKDSCQTVQMVATEQLRSKFMSALPSSSCKSVFTQVVDNMSTSTNPELSKQCRKLIKHMSLDSSLVIDELKSVLAKNPVATVREAKRQKEYPSNTLLDSTLETLPWKRVTMLLEIIQNKKKVKNAVEILPVVFQVLGRLLELEEKGAGEYIKQLILGAVNFICTRRHDDLESDAVKGEHLNMDLIVQCIRSSDNPHTHHQALLLLSSAAKIAPDLLLHNMMSVFTFMGASILRQDDAYSFHVIGRILENVIPALFMACEEKSKDKQPSKKNYSSKLSSSGNESSEDMMTMVLRVFVDAIPHIPSHRKIVLFEKLVSVVGAENYLWRLLLLFLERVTVQPSRIANPEDLVGEENVKPSGPLSTSDLEFMASLTEQFSCPQLFRSFTQALGYVAQLPDEKPEGLAHPTRKAGLGFDEVGPKDKEIFSVSHHTPKQLRHFKFATVYALKELVSGQHLLAQMSEAEPSSFLPDFQSFMENCLQFISHVTQLHEKHRLDNSGKFLRILLHKTHDLLDSLVTLLPDSMFMDMVSGLMTHSLLSVQRRSLEILNAKLQQYRENVSADQIPMLLSMFSKLQSIARQCLLKGGKSAIKDEELVNGQTALYSLKVLSRVLGEKHVQHFMEALGLYVKILSRHHTNGMVSASAMMCVAEVVSNAKVHTLEMLGQFLPLIISQLQTETITDHEVLLLAAITSLQKIIESLPLFLSPYLLDIIVQVCKISSLAGAHSSTHRPVVLQKIKLICTTLATATPTRSFVPALEKSLSDLGDRIALCAECAMSMLKDHIVNMTREDLSTFSQDLLKFFFTCFDLRATKGHMFSEADLDTVEGCVIDAFVAMVFKLSEAQFKPILVQLYTWATDEDVSRERVLFFYRLCNNLAEKLKNLFTLFAGHIIKHSAEMLDANNKSKNKCNYFGKSKMARRKSCQLLCYLLDCLQKTFAHDTEGFVNKERFDVLMQPLVDQLENQLGKSSVSEDRVNKHLLPCLASLATAAQDDSLWKDMNYQILLKTRHQDAKVRIWALSAVDVFHQKLGEDYTQFVPETIPFMAELMEDESDEVEKHTQKVLAAMEVSVGENLQEYF